MLWPPFLLPPDASAVLVSLALPLFLGAMLVGNLVSVRKEEGKVVGICDLVMVLLPSGVAEIEGGEETVGRAWLPSWFH